MCTIHPSIIQQYPNIIQSLETTVRQFLDQSQMFTGYDITIETRNREKMKLRHSDIHGALHDISVLKDAVEFGHDDPSGQTAKWQKSQAQMSNGQWAFVYHPAGVDPNTYSARPAAVAQPMMAITQQSVVNAITVSDGDGSVSDSGGENDDGSFSVDYRGRLLIPTRFLRDLGLRSGDMAYIVQDSNVLFVGATDLHMATATQQSQKVERNGDLRLSSRNLNYVGDNVKKFNLAIHYQNFSDGNGLTAIQVLEVSEAK